MLLTKGRDRIPSAKMYLSTRNHPSVNGKDPPEHLSDYSVNVRKRPAVTKVRKSALPDNSIDFASSFALDVGIQNHGEHERGKGGYSLHSGR